MRERDIFIEVLQKADPAECSAYLDEACAGDDALRQRVLQLLAEHEKQESFLLDAPAHLLANHASDTVDQSTNETAGTLIGPYKLLEQIGEGGMGTVWMAQQTEPVKRVVALKLIKAGMDSKQVIARFEAERQALALMDHANIARVLDAGATENGRPYFVMDLVKGVAITKYCDEHYLTPRQRLELFITVCQAVQHAHQKGIIHRDLKPSNVLVAIYDGRPVPKVIDFGVAKATGQKLTEKTLVTGFGTIVGTLEYMSPEQAEVNQLDIDTRSDIYSLGVLLYELLAGSPPFTKHELENVGMLEMLRVIREQEPSKPSTKLSSSDALPTLSANRGTEPAKLTKLVRGELDWIVMKALEKDRNRRYETANGFAMDLQRYLADEPVEACPPSVGYRMRKFVRRHTASVLVTGAIVGLLLGLLAVALGSNYQINLAYLTLEAEQQKTAEALLRETELKNQETELKNKTKVALDSERMALHSYRLALSHREWRANNVGRADALLDECLPEMRHWEWHYLKRLCHTNLLTLRHTWGVTSVVFSPDGKRIASAGLTRPVFVRDAETGRELLRLESANRRLAFSPDGKYLASLDKDRTVGVWDAATGKSIFKLPALVGAVRGIAFSPDGRRFAAFSSDSIVKLWDVSDGRELLQFTGHKSGVHGLAFSPDGSAVVSVADGVNAAIIWNPATGEETRRFGVAHGAMMCVAFNHNGRRLVTGNRSGVIQVWDSASGQELFKIQTESQVEDVSFSPDGRLLASAHRDQTTKVWDAQSGLAIETLRGHTGMVNKLAFSPDGRRLATASGDHTVKVWRPTAGQEYLACDTMPSKASGLVVHPDSRRFVIGHGDGSVSVWDATTGKQLDSWSAGQGVIHELAVSPDRSRLATAGARRGLAVWELKTGTPVTTYGDPTTSLFTVAFSPDGQLLASGGNEGGIIRVWDSLTAKQLRALEADYKLSTTSVAFSPEGRRLATGGQFGPAIIWDVPSGKVLHRLRGPDEYVLRVAFTPNGMGLAVAYRNKMVVLWDANTGMEKTRFGPHPIAVHDVAFTPDGKRLATVAGGAVVIWDTTTGREALTLRGDKVFIRRVAFTPDGRRLICIGDDGIAKVFDGTPLDAVPTPAGPPGAEG